MNLKHISLEQEDERQWLVRDGRTGKTFPLAKKGLAQGLHDQIAQHFAEGGEVKAAETPLKERLLAAIEKWGNSPQGERMLGPLLAFAERLNEGPPAPAAPEGGPTMMGPSSHGDELLFMDAPGAPVRVTAFEPRLVSRTAQPQPAAPVAPEPQVIAAMGLPRLISRTPAPMPAPQVPAGPPMIAQAPVRMAEGGPVLSFTDPDAPPSDGVPTNQEARTRMLMQRAMAPPPAAPAPQPAPWLPPPGPAVLAPGQEAPSAPAQAPVAPVQPRGPTPGAVPDSGMRAAYAQARAAAMAKADVDEQKAIEQEKLAQDKMMRDEQVAQAWDARYLQNMARIDRLQADVASGKVDPQRWWDDQSAGGNLGRKVTASIALILGGLGQAFGGGPNQALATINTLIERDIDAQKADLGRKQNLLSHYVQQGHDIQSAKQLAMADAAKMYAGELERNKAKFSGKEARVQADATIAELNAKAAQAYQAAHQQGFQNQLQVLDRARLEEEAQAKLTKSILDRTGLVAPGWAKGDVQIGDDEGKAFRTGLAAAEKLKAEAKELQRLIKAHGSGIGNNLNLPTAIKRKMNSLATSVLLGVNTGVAKLGALAGHDVSFLQDLAPNPTQDMRPEFWAQNAAAYDQLIRSVDQLVETTGASMGLRRVAGGIRTRDEQLEAAAKNRGGE